MNVFGRFVILLAMAGMFLWTWFDERFVTPAARRVRLRQKPAFHRLAGVPGLDGRSR